MENNATNKQTTPVIKDLKLEKHCDSEHVRSYIEENNITYTRGKNLVSLSSLWNMGFLPKELTDTFYVIKNITTEDRLNICKQQASISPNQRKSKPQHILYDNDALMVRVSDLFHEAFSEDLIFDFKGGSKLPIHIGHIPISDGIVDRAGDAYIAEVRKNPLLDQQGDGMKSYAGILFETIVTERSITLLDEPEAFLHPPQMRKLGETLSSEVKGQLIVATHSSDILRGFLEGTKGKVKILRIQREGDANTVHEANIETIKELWTQPVLRYSNALEGLFHHQTVICEADSDCRLINAVADHLNSTRNTPFKDTSYVPSGGKHGIPKIASALKKVGVPIKAVFDIDFLSEEPLVKNMVNALEGEWSTIKALWKKVDTAVKQGFKLKSSQDINDEIIKAVTDAKPTHPSKNNSPRFCMG